VLLHRLGAGDDIVVGAPVAGRTDDALDDLVGFFVNTLVLRTDLSGDPSFAEALERVRVADLAAFEHQDLPFEQVVDALAPARVGNRNPLFQVMVGHVRRGPLGEGLLGLDTEAVPYDPGVAKFDLNWILAEEDGADGVGHLDIAVEYSADRFDRSTVDRLIAELAGLIAAVVADPDAPISALPVASVAERRVGPMAAGPAVPPAVDRASPPGAGRATAAVAASAPPTPVPSVSRADVDRIRSLFAQVLHRDVTGVGAGDDFFALGGDSIVAIALVSAARTAGLPIRARHVFEAPTPAALAAKVAGLLEDERGSGADGRSTGADHDAEEAMGQVVPLPVVHWLRERGGAVTRAHQSTVVQVPAGASAARLQEALTAVVAHHHALRLRLDRDRRVPSVWRTEIRPVDAATEACTFGHVAVDPAIDADGWRSAVAMATEQAIDGLDPDTGRMVQARWLDAGPTTAGRLVIVAHHLVVDVVSWSVLLPDLAHAHHDLERGAVPALEPVPVALRRWSRAVTDRTHDTDVLRDLDRWMDTVAPGASLVGGAAGVTSAAGTRVTAVIDDELAAAVLGPVPAAVHGRVDDVLLAALALAASRWRRSRGDGESADALLVEVEGHGREDDRFDLSRTVGWLTTVRPVRIPTDVTDAGATLKATKEAVRAGGPSAGTDYGVLRYLHPQSAPLLRVGQIDVLCNYLGRVGAPVAADWFPAPEHEVAELVGAAEVPVVHALQLDAHAEDTPDGPRLVLRWATDGRLSATDLGDLRSSFVAALEELATWAATPDAGAFTPSDVPSLGLDQQALDALAVSRPGGIDALWPLTPLQQGLHFLSSFDGTGTDGTGTDGTGLDGTGLDVYTVQLILELGAALDERRLDRALGALLRRHPNLRAGFVAARDGSVVQVVARDVAIPRRTVDAADVDALLVVAADDRTRRFDLREPPLVRATLARTPEGDRLVLTAHHTVVDGWSMPLLVTEIQALYGADGDERAAGLAPAVSFERYLDWLAARDVDEARAAWRCALGGLAEPTHVVAPDPARPARLPDVRRVTLPRELVDRLGAEARRRGLTMSTVVNGAWALLLAKLTGRTDVVFGTTVSGRNPDVPGIESMIGVFINTVPVRVRLRMGESLGDLLVRLQTEQAELLDHQHLGLAEVQRLAEPAGASGGDLFDTLVVFENQPIAAPEVAPVEGVDSATGTAGSTHDRDGDRFALAGGSAADATHYPLTLAVDPGPGLTLALEAHPDVFDAAEADALVARLVRALEAFADRPDAPVAGVDLLDDVERHELRRAGAGAPIVTHAAAGPVTIPDAVLAWADTHPGATALVDAHTCVTYGELRDRVHRLARHLLATDDRVAPEAVVALALTRTVAVVETLLAVQQAGAAYLPLDPGAPVERLRELLDDAGPVLLITESSTGLAGALGDAVPVVVIDDPATGAAIDGQDPTPVTDGERRGPLTGDHAAYVIYTSGSTGRPKGVVVPHRNVLALLHHHRRRLFAPTAERLGRPLRIAHAWPFSFDASWQPMLGLLDGHAVHIAGDDVRRDPERLAAMLRDDGIDFIEVTPSHFGQLAAAGLMRDGQLPLSLLGVGGEAVPPPLWSQLSELDGTEAWNFYGPTEATVDTVVARVRDTDAAVIGAPVDGTTAHVLDDGLAPVLPGVIGDLYLGGPQIARGYLGRPDLTAERFVADPDGPPGARLYRTGDAVRRRVDGTIDFVGRADDQVKIRGFRIELGEVEAAVARHDDVGQVTVAAVTPETGPARLVAYIVAATGATVDPRAVRAHTGALLPDHMVPAAVVVLDALPTTPNGKLDRAALPAPDFAALASSTPPRNDREAALAAAFARALGLPQVGIDDSFFELGGDSIVSMQLVTLAREAGLVLTPREVFTHTTVAALAAIARGTDELVVEEAGANLGRVEPTPIVHWLRELGGPIGRFHQVAVLEVPAGLALADVVATFQRVVDHHDALRLVLHREDDDQWHLEVPPAGAVPAGDRIERVAVDHLDDAARADEALAAWDRAAGALDPDGGVMWRATWLDAGDGAPGRVVFVVHHLATDGVSWRVLLPDLEAASRSLADGTEPRLSPVGTSLRRWSQLLHDEARHPARLAELDRWEAQLGPVEPLGSRPVDPAIDLASTERDHVEIVPAPVTAGLLTAAVAHYRASMDELLLAALAAAFGRPVVVELEGHGREEVVGGADLSNTVGWFTSLTPVRLDVGEAASAVDPETLRGESVDRLVDAVQAQLRALPDGGIGFGALRHLNPEARAVLAAHPRPQVLFNYLGRFDRGLASAPATAVTEVEAVLDRRAGTVDAAGTVDGWRPAPEAGLFGGGADPAMPLSRAIEVNAVTVDGPDGPELRATWSWPDGVLTEDEVGTFAERWRDALAAIVRRAASA